MLTTKAFAELCETTKKTIIHYDRIGLLPPYKRQGIFRLYTPKQVLLFQKIALLKTFGMTLQEIKKYLKRDHLLLSLFETKRKQLEQQKTILVKRIDKAREFVDSLKNHNLLVTPKVKTIKPFWTYGFEKTGRYVDIAAYQREIFPQIKDDNYEKPGITIFHNRKYSPDNSRMFTGVYFGAKKPQLPETHLIQLPEHTALTYMHIGAYSYMSYIWQFLNKYVLENGLEENRDLDCREIYWHGSLAGYNEEDFVTEMQIPLK